MTQYLHPVTRRLVPRTVVDDADVGCQGPELEQQYEEVKALARLRMKAESRGYVAVCSGGLPTLGRRR
ncbi:hypothetical protein ABTY96_42870 [Streptomyces sp. NPDC096057]|uniref:hypothetical protein n=1 Tax=Streptomyces sp. NPDC096057 TaxID=3155543 RepID=UPI00331A459B